MSRVKSLIQFYENISNKSTAKRAQVTSPETVVAAQVAKVEEEKKLEEIKQSKEIIQEQVQTTEILLAKASLCTQPSLFEIKLVQTTGPFERILAQLWILPDKFENKTPKGEILFKKRKNYRKLLFFYRRYTKWRFKFI